MAGRLFNLASVMDDPRLIALTEEPKLLIAGVAPNATDYRVTATGGSERTLAAMAAEHDLLTGSTPTAGIGTVGAATVAATEYGDARDHLTLLTLTAFAAGTSGDNAAKAIGNKIYTFPAGIIMVEWASLIALATTAAISITTDTPEVGLGTVIGSGVNATLGAVGATSENIFEGTAIADVAATPFTGTKFPLAGPPFLIAAASVHDVFLNYAVTWADVAAVGAVTATGTVVMKWHKLT